jgi:hypothetical protein
MDDPISVTTELFTNTVLEKPPTNEVPGKHPCPVTAFIDWVLIGMPLANTLADPAAALEPQDTESPILTTFPMATLRMVEET